MYVDHQSNVIIIDVKWKSDKEIGSFLPKLRCYEQYQHFISIIESEPGESLMTNSQLSKVDYYPLSTQLVGNGSSIAVLDNSIECLDALLNSRSISSLSEASRSLGTEVKGSGTMACICSLNGEFYAMTAQHVLDQGTSEATNKHILSEVKYTCDGLYIADLIHLSSTQFGKFGTIDRQRAVDVALMKLNQRSLDTGSMKLMPIFTRSHIEALFPDRPSVLFREVSKIGASSGLSLGEIIMEDFAYPIHREMGTMFAVDGIGNEIFATKGDSGSLVTISIAQPGSVCQEYAIGIVSQRKEVRNKPNAVLCVW